MDHKKQGIWAGLAQAGMDEKHKGWANSKKQALRKLNAAVTAGEADEKALPLIRKINASQEYYTTSSCAGRIALIGLAKFGSKKDSGFLGRWHGPAKWAEFCKCLRPEGRKQAWMKAEPPILHVKCADLASAQKLLNTAYNTGWKYSSIKSLRDGVLVEIGSSERMELPVAIGGKLIATESYLRTVLRLANEKLRKAQGKLKRLEKAL